MVDIKPFLALLPTLKQRRNLGVNYDAESDVLYVAFSLQAADDSELTDNDVIERYHAGALIGATILHASERTLE